MSTPDDHAGHHVPGDALRGIDLARVVDLARCGLVVVDIAGTVRYASATAAQLVGTRPDDAIGGSILDWLHPDDVERALASLEMNLSISGINFFPMVFRLRHAAGHHFEVDVLVTNLLHDDGVEGIVLSVRHEDDRTQFIDPIRALAAGADHRDVLELIASGVGRGGHVLRSAGIVWSDGVLGDADTQIAMVRADDSVSAAVLHHIRRHGAEITAAIAATSGRHLASQAVDELPDALRSLLVERGVAGLRLAGIPTGGGSAVLLSLEPVDTWVGGHWTPSSQDHWGQLVDLATVAFERDRVHRQLRHAATHDALTGLANRTHFFDTLERLGGTQPMTVLYLDLDRFKAVNDLHGHFRGDEVLVEVATRLRSAVPVGGLVARLGGDEFAMAMLGDDPDDIAALVASLRAAVAAPYPGHLEVSSLGISIGVATVAPGHAIDEAVRRADRGLLEQKRARHESDVTV